MHRRRLRVSRRVVVGAGRWTGVRRPETRCGVHYTGSLDRSEETGNATSDVAYMTIAFIVMHVLYRDARIALYIVIYICKYVFIVMHIL